MSLIPLVHVVLMISAFAVFTVSFVIGLVFLVQESRVKRHNPALFRNLPPLEVLDGIHYKALTIGFALLSLGILMGAVLSKQTWGQFFTSDRRQMATLVVWGIYALFLNVRIQAGWRGRRGMALSVLGFAGVVLAFLGVGHRGF